MKILGFAFPLCVALMLGGCGGDASPIARGPDTSSPPSPPPPDPPPPPPLPIVLAGAKVGDTLQFDEICSNALMAPATMAPAFYVTEAATGVLDSVDIGFTLLGSDHYKWSAAGQADIEILPTTKVSNGDITHHYYYIPSVPTLLSIAGENASYPLQEVVYGSRNGPNNCFFAGGFRDPMATPLLGEFAGTASGDANVDGTAYRVFPANETEVEGKPTVSLTSDGNTIDVTIRIIAWDYDWWDTGISLDVGTLRASVKPSEIGVATLEGDLVGYTGEIMVRSLSDGNAVSGWFRLTKESNFVFGVFAAEKSM